MDDALLLRYLGVLLFCHLFLVGPMNVNHDRLAGIKAKSAAVMTAARDHLAKAGDRLHRLMTDCPIWLRFVAFCLLALVILPVRAILAFIGLLSRWLANILGAILDDRGYVTVGSIVGVYLAVYGLMDAKHQREENQASLERNIFVTLVSSGNPSSFVVALKSFAKVQNIKAMDQPSLIKFWTWGHNSAPNRDFMTRWAKSQLPLCKPNVCSLDAKWRVDLQDADLEEIDLEDTDLSGVDLSRANMTRAKLKNTNLSNSTLVLGNLSGADLRHARLENSVLFHANFSRADLSTVDLRGTQMSHTRLDRVVLTGAVYDNRTNFPEDFDFDEAAKGMLYQSCGVLFANVLRLAGSFILPPKSFDFTIGTNGDPNYVRGRVTVTPWIVCLYDQLKFPMFHYEYGPEKNVLEERNALGIDILEGDASNAPYSWSEIRLTLNDGSVLKTSEDGSIVKILGDGSVLKVPDLIYVGAPSFIPKRVVRMEMDFDAGVGNTRATLSWEDSPNSQNR